MAKEKFENRKMVGSMNVACKFDDGSVRYWEADKAEVVKRIVSLVELYIQKGHRLTLRQLHYQFVSRNWIVNHDTAYKKLGTILDDCRYSGLIDWNGIEDRGRRPYLPYWVRDIKHALEDTADQYRIDLQDGQSNHVELWTEKDALSGILRDSTVEYHIQLVVNKGYTSSSAIYEAYRRCLRFIKSGTKSTILYFGDHDPSGLDMVRDIKDRMIHFLCRGYDLQRSKEVRDWWDEEQYTVSDVVDHTGNIKIGDVLRQDLSEERLDELYDEFEAGKVSMYLHEKELFEVKHIGLTMEQIKRYKPPPNPTKLTDTRADKYIRQFGKTCWEVDALDPETLTDLVKEHVEDEIDMDQFNAMLKRQEKETKEIKSLIKKLK